MTKLLTEVPEALYRILTSLILVPKTLVKVIIAPRWIPRYVEAELQKQPSENRFDNYSHPITFFIIVAVAPAIVMFNIFIRCAQLINGKTFTLWPTTALMSVPNEFAQATQETIADLQSLNIETEFLAVFVLLVSWPLAAALVVQLVRYLAQKRHDGKNRNQKKKLASVETNFSITGLRPVLYTQSYWFAAVYFYHFLAMAVLFFLTNFFTGSFSLTVQQIVFVLPFIYFVYCQACIVQEQAKIGPLNSFFIVLGIICFGLATEILCEIIVFLPLFITHRH